MPRATTPKTTKKKTTMTTARCVEGVGRYSLVKPSNTPTGRGLCANGFKPGTEVVGYDERLYVCTQTATDQLRWKLVTGFPRPLPRTKAVRVMVGVDGARPRAGKIKDPSAPKRAPSAYNKFMSKHMKARPASASAKAHFALGAKLWSAQKK